MLNLDMSSSQTDATEFANAVVAKRRSMIFDDFWKGRTKGFFGSITWCKQLVIRTNEATTVDLTVLGAGENTSYILIEALLSWAQV